MLLAKTKNLSVIICTFGHIADPSIHSSSSEMNCTVGSHFECSASYLAGICTRNCCSRLVAQNDVWICLDFSFFCPAAFVCSFIDWLTAYRSGKSVWKRAGWLHDNKQLNLLEICIWLCSHTTSIQYLLFLYWNIYLLFLFVALSSYRTNHFSCPKMYSVETMNDRPIDVSLIFFFHFFFFPFI